MELVVFPETWLPGYPAWLDFCRDAALWDHAPVKEVFARLAASSLVVDGDSGRALGRLAAEAGVTLVLGASERVAHGPGAGPFSTACSPTGRTARCILKAKGLIIFARVDHGGEAQKAGLQLRPTQLLIFGNPKTGTPLMSAAPLIALDLPLKALAWQDDSGKVWLSYVRPAELQRRHGLPEDTVKVLAASETLIQQALE